MSEDLGVPPLLPEDSQIPRVIWAPPTVGGTLRATWTLITGHRAVLTVALIGLVIATMAVVPPREFPAREPVASPGAALSLLLPGWKMILFWISEAILTPWLILTAAGEHEDTAPTPTDTLRLAIFRAPLYLATSIITVLACMPGFFVCIIPGVIIWLHIVLAVQHSVLEKKGPISSIRHSWNQSEGLPGLLFILILIQIALIVPVQSPLMVWDMKHQVYAEVTGKPLWHWCYELGLVVYSGAIGRFFVVAHTWIYLERRAGRI